MRCSELRGGLNRVRLPPSMAHSMNFEGISETLTVAEQRLAIALVEQYE
jgi:hypothetical protein